MPISIARGQRERARDEGVGVDARVVDGRRRAHQELEPMAEVAEVDGDDDVALVADDIAAGRQRFAAIAQEIARDQVLLVAEGRGDERQLDARGRRRDRQPETTARFDRDAAIESIDQVRRLRPDERRRFETHSAFRVGLAAPGVRKSLAETGVDHIRAQIALQPVRHLAHGAGDGTRRVGLGLGQALDEVVGLEREAHRIRSAARPRRSRPGPSCPRPEWR
jgi:hypothetical protein